MSFLKRLLSTLILAPLFIGALYYGGVVYQSVIAIMMIVAAYEFWNMSRHEVKKGLSHAVLIVGVIYCMTAYIAFIDLRDGYGFTLTGLIIIGVWASDIGGYIFGKLIGGRKLCPSISPNKTWAGLIGACLFPFFILDGYLAFFVQSFNAAQVMIWALSASLVVGVLGQVGDLSISMLKRRVGVKDTGKLIPGHGGVLDRIDALMLVMIVCWMLLKLKVAIWNADLFVF